MNITKLYVHPQETSRAPVDFAREGSRVGVPSDIWRNLERGENRFGIGTD